MKFSGTFDYQRILCLTRGPQFTSRVWKAFCRCLCISLTSGYPHSNGQGEWANQEIGRYRQTHCSRDQHRWIGFQSVLGYQPHQFFWSGETLWCSCSWVVVPKEQNSFGDSTSQRAIWYKEALANRQQCPHPIPARSICFHYCTLL